MSDYSLFLLFLRTTLASQINQGRNQDFQRGGRFFIEKGKAGSERSERCLRRWVPGWSPGRHSISLDLKAPDCEKIDILNAFFFSLNFSNTMTTFMVTFNFLISLLLFFPLYDFNFFISFSKGISGKRGVGHPPTPPWLRACKLYIYCKQIIYLQ